MFSRYDDTVKPNFDVIRLTQAEQAMLQGYDGPARQLAMRILARVAPLYGAEKLVTVTQAHVDGVILTGPAGLDFAERLAALGGEVAVPTTLNVMSMDRQRWRELGQDQDFANRAGRLGEAYLKMGASPTFTCAPYQSAQAPKFGDQIAWSESNAVAFANSIIGARSNRYGDYLDICCALTGRAPAAGLHLDEPRLATVVVELQHLPPALPERDDFYPILGYLLGILVQDGVPAVVGLATDPGEDQLKALCAAAASSGALAMIHLVGITPEAETLRDALGEREPQRVLRVSLSDLREARAQLSTSSATEVDVVAFGSPHCSLSECRQLAALMVGRRASSGVDVYVTTSRAVRDILARTSDLETLERFGAQVVADTCVLVAPLIRRDAKHLMTNSAKYAHYSPGLLGVDVSFGSTEDCVESAIQGRAIVDDGPWA
jgi:predicted aconitase